MTQCLAITRQSRVYHAMLRCNASRMRTFPDDKKSVRRSLLLGEENQDGDGSPRAAKWQQCQAPEPRCGWGEAPRSRTNEPNKFHFIASPLLIN